MSGSVAPGMRKLIRSGWVLPVRLYQRFLSPCLPKSCRFVPTCSDYAITAVERYGLLKGTALAMWRICRCNPLCRGGYDPVPEQRATANCSPRPLDG